MPSWLGPWEILIVVVIILLIFGGKLIPRLGSAVGRSILGLKKGLKEGEEGFKTAIKEEEEAATLNAASKDAAATQPTAQSTPQDTEKG